MQIIEGKEKILSGYSAYLQDESKLSAGEIQYLAFPETEKDIAEFLKQMSGKNVSVTVSNGKTGVVGGAVPLSGALLSVEKMDKITDIKKIGDEWRVVCQAGTVLSELNKKIENYTFSNSEEYFYPVDVTETSTRIGGNVSTNASGERSFKYGSTRKWIRRLRIVLSTGDILEIERGKIFASKENEFEVTIANNKKITVKIPSYKMPSIKNAAGYYVKENMDLIDLFIGSEGTLGVVSEVEVALTKKPENVMALLAFFADEKDALSFFSSAKKELKTAIVFEYFDSGAFELLRPKLPELPEDKNSAIFFEAEFNDNTIDDISSIIEKLLKDNNSSMDNTWGGFEKKDMERIREIRHAIPETINEILAKRKQKFPNIHKISADIAVPDEKFSELIEYYKSILEPLKLQTTMFGHIGENHLHMNIIPRNDGEFSKAKELHFNFAKKAVSLGGTVSAEHGIGKIKHPYLEVMYGKDGLKQMAELKKSFDPKCILNRGNIFPEDLLCVK
ncbi:MAG: FAD-binding oxidoreductase [Elusimicrobia bacterium]|nr:FAD-binding oxidoreductase [Elusimicrobiota bacterium]